MGHHLLMIRRHQFQIHISISAEVILAFLGEKNHFGFVNLKGLKTKLDQYTQMTKVSKAAVKL